MVLRRLAKPGGGANASPPAPYQTWAEKLGLTWAEGVMLSQPIRYGLQYTADLCDEVRAKLALRRKIEAKRHAAQKKSTKEG